MRSGGLDPRPGQPLLGRDGSRVGDLALVDALAEVPRPLQVAPQRPSAGGPGVLVGVILVAGVEAHLVVARFGVARFRRAWRDYAIPRRC